jgi:hypothetical protein
MSIEDRFDIALVAGLALREKQIQQNYRPIIFREEIEHLKVTAYQAEAARLVGNLREKIGQLYLTDCPK